MRRTLVLMPMLTLSLALTASQSEAANFDRCVAKKDDLCLRVIAKKLSPARMNLAAWQKVRSVLQKRPGVGWDVLLAWDQNAPKSSVSADRQTIDQKLIQADQLMSAGRFKESTPLYEQVAESIRGEGVSLGQPNFFLYQTVLHSLARSYFGSGAYQDAITVDQWISVTYPFVREVQFEKMWAASKIPDAALTLGAIASQMSSYFSRYLEPEAYLIQYYTYRRLCRTNDLKQVSNSILRYKSVLDKNQLTLEEWSRRDNETLAYWRLIDPKRESSGELSKVEAGREVKAIRAMLVTRYRKDVVRLKTQMAKVAAYLNLSDELENKDLPSIAKIGSTEKFIKSGQEMWPVQDAEDWIDEIGHHVFIGKSQCAR